MKLEHVALNVPDPKAAAAWYAEHLGLKIVLANEESPYIHFLSDGAGAMLELYSNPEADIPDYAAIDPFTFHVAFAVADLEAEVERLVAAGAGRDGDIHMIGGNRIAFLRDPWGVTVQLVWRAVPFAS